MGWQVQHILLSVLEHWCLLLAPLDPGLKLWHCFWFDTHLHTQSSLNRECVMVQIHFLYIRCPLLFRDCTQHISTVANKSIKKNKTKKKLERRLWIKQLKGHNTEQCPYTQVPLRQSVINVDSESKRHVAASTIQANHTSWISTCPVRKQSWLWISCDSCESSGPDNRWNGKARQPRLRNGF